MPELQQIGKYKIVELIGQGGMGVVYKAFDPYIQRHVAIKLLSQTLFGNQENVRRFVREAQAIGQLRHPNIIIIFDAGEIQHRPYLVVELLEGNDLEVLLEQGKVPPLHELLDIFIGIAEALHYSHGKKILHRDIKPSNIFYETSGLAKLMDFGIAKLEGQTMTKSGSLLGSPHYMSPEQIEGEGIDARTDIYSLGVVMYQIFTQKKPFDGRTISEVFAKILFSRPTEFENDLQIVPTELSSVVMKAFARKAEDRYQTAAELLLDLKKVKYLLGLDPASLYFKQTSETTRDITGQFEPSPDSRVRSKVSQKTRPRGRSRKKKKLLISLLFLLVVAGSAIRLRQKIEEIEIPASIKEMFAGAAKELSPAADKEAQNVVQPSPQPTFQVIPTVKEDQSEESEQAVRDRRSLIETQWSLAQKKNQRSGYEIFIETYADDPLASVEIEKAKEVLLELEQQAQKIAQEREKLIDALRQSIINDWSAAQKKNTRQAFQQFISTYQFEDAAREQVKEAMSLLILADWNDTVKKNTPEAFQRFISTYQYDELAQKHVKAANAKIKELEKSKKPGHLIVIVPLELGWVSVYDGDVKLLDTPSSPYKMRPGTYNLKILRQGKDVILSTEVVIESDKTTYLDLRNIK